MLKLFEPQSKIQKDKQIIRETDMRMAKYSRRGIITNIVVYTLCLFVEQGFIQSYPKLAIFLTSGIVLSTLWRGYLLFRMESIYPRGPMAWRNRYFLATLVGAGWWGFMLASLTLLMNMTHEASLMWLYTVVFFSTTAHAFAPYQRFLTLYQFLGLVPAACCAFFIGDLVGFFYGSILLFFFWMLIHHCDLIARTYWEGLDVKYLLAKRPASSEQKRIGEQASDALTYDYLRGVQRQLNDLRVSEKGIKPSETTDGDKGHTAIDQLTTQLDHFLQALNPEAPPQVGPINIRHYVQSLMSLLVADAEKKGIELDSILANTLPFRVYVDAAIVGRIITTLIKSAVSESQSGSLLFLWVEYVADHEDRGALHLSISRQLGTSKRSIFSPEKVEIMEMTSDVLLAKVLTLQLNGQLSAQDDKGRLVHVSFPVRLAGLHNPLPLVKKPSKPKRLLLVHPDARWLDYKRQALDFLGFEVVTTSDPKKALTQLLSAFKDNMAFDGVLFNCAQEDLAYAEFSFELLAHNELKYINQFVITSISARQWYVEQVKQLGHYVHFIHKPAGIYELALATSDVLFNLERSETQTPVPRILWINEAGSSKTPAFKADEPWIIQTPSNLKKAFEAWRESAWDLVIIQSADGNVQELVKQLHDEERLDDRDLKIPVLGVGLESTQEAFMNAGVDHWLDQNESLNVQNKELKFWANGNRF